MTIREALAQASADLKKAGIETSNLDASLLLAHILKTNRASLAASGTEPLSEENHAALRALIQRRLNGECVAYIIGKKEFRGLEFLVNSSVLVPRPDTETLVEAAIAICREWGVGSGEWGEERREKRKEKKGREGVVRVLDLCTGSGAVAIALKNEMPDIEVHASDISVEALETAKANTARLLPANSIHFHLGDLYNAISSLHCSLFTDNYSLLPPHSPLPTPYSLIICNPPYIPTEEIKTLSTEVQNEPRIALDGGKSGLEIIERIIDGAPEYLERGGTLLMEADPRQMKDIALLLEKKGFIKIIIFKDLSGQERVIGGKYE